MPQASPPQIVPDPELEQDEATVGESLKAKLARRREELHAERSFVLPIEGFADLGLAARYQVLTFRELRAIGEKLDPQQRGKPEGEVVVAADTLIRACVELVAENPEATGEEDRWIGLGKRWNSAAVVELFGADDLPADATARAALRWVLPETELMLHFDAYDRQMSVVAPKVQEALSGESEPSQEG